MPHNTKITSAKIKRKKRRATFSFTGDDALSFQCALVKPKPKKKGKHKKAKVTFSPCSSPKSYKKLKPGKNTFEVRGVNSAGSDPSPAIRKFKI
jgi:hypothetical protein